MYKKLISHIFLSTQEKSSSTATLRYSCPWRLPKIPRNYLRRSNFLELVLVMENPV